MSMEEEEITPAAPQPEPVPAEPTPVAATDAPAEGGEEKSEAPRIAYGANPNVNLFAPVFLTGKGPRFRAHERLAAYGATSAEVAALSEYYPQQNLGDSPQIQNWVDVSTEADRHLVDSDVYEPSLARPSNWSNSVRSNGTQLHVARPRAEKSDGEKLTGEAAMMRIQAVMGIGSTARVPLWHSGLWVTLKAPQDAALLELERRIATDKVNLGRSTSGLVFSSAGVYITDAVVDFALAHVMEATYRYSDVSELKAIIDQPDQILLAHGLLCTIYPNGYPYSQPCVADPTKCTHVLQELISIPKICFTDQMRLTEKQLRHMERRTAKFTPEEIRDYKAEHTYLSSRVVELTPKVSIVLRVPTIEQARQIGVTWVEGITTKVERSFAASIPPKVREEYIMDQAKITSMCQYAHWVEKIVIVDDGVSEEIIDISAITNVLSTIGSDQAAYKAYYDGVQRFIADSTISLVAVPKVPCPKCGKEPNLAEEGEEDPSKHPHLLPLDVINVFFTLLGLRLTSIFTNDV
jgi:hypothetical protein